MSRPPQPPGMVTVNDSLNENAFVSYTTGEDNSAAFAAYGRAIDKIEPIQRSTGALANQYRNIDNNGASVRSGFTRLDYEFFRPAESVPRMQKQIIAACMAAYDKIGIVRNIIDTMGDFTVQGIRFEHPNKQIEAFFNNWFKKVDGLDRSERFVNLFYRGGNVLTKRSRGKIKSKVAEEWKRSVAQESVYYEDDFDSVKSKEIPLRYTFLNPMAVDTVAHELTPFTGKNYYIINIPPALIRIINNPKDQYEQEIIASMPTDIVNAVRNGSKKIPISDDDLIVYHYKKDDWQVWANPMTYAILDDLITLEKMKLADLAALDGAISHIRIWKLGSLEHQILPTDAAIAKLADLLLNNVGGGSMDLIWGPDLELEETSTEIQKFLGSAKYEVCLSSIYAGLGVPPTMTGSSSGGGGGGFNQNFISLKTLTERLKYGRSKLKQFWTYEVEMVQKAMGFKEAPTITFDFPNLGDEIAEKALWLQAVDRGLISDESFQNKFGMDPETERRRLGKEYVRRGKKNTPPKASPYHDAEPELSLKKILAQRGQVTPSELGLILEERAPGEKTPVEVQQEQQQQQLEIKSKGTPGQGRPTNSKDTKSRKRRATKASEEFISLAVWAQEAQKAIAEVVTPFFLDKFEKADLRQLTADEQTELEDFKFALLLNSPAYSSLDEESIYNLTQEPFSVYNQAEELVGKFITEIKSRGEAVTLDQIRKIHCMVYAVEKGDTNVNNNDND